MSTRSGTFPLERVSSVARKFCEEGVRKNPLSVDCRLQLGRACLASGKDDDLDLARIAFERAMLLSELRSVPAFTGLATTFLKVGSYKKCLATLDFLLGKRQVEKVVDGLAVKVTEESVPEGTLSLEAWSLKAQVFLAQDLHQAAADTLIECLKKKGVESEWNIHSALTKLSKKAGVRIPRPTRFNRPYREEPLPVQLKLLFGDSKAFLNVFALAGKGNIVVYEVKGCLNLVNSETRAKAFSEYAKKILGGIKPIQEFYVYSEPATGARKKTSIPFVETVTFGKGIVFKEVTFKQMEDDCGFRFFWSAEQKKEKTV